MYKFYYLMLIVVFTTFIVLLSHVYMSRKTYEVNLNYKRPLFKVSEFDFVHGLISSFSILLFIYCLIRFILSYIGMKSLFIPNYLSHWYNLFQIKKIDKMIHMFYLEEDTIKVATILLYLKDLLRFILSFIVLFIFIYFINTDIKSILVFDDGIYRRGVFYRWDKRISYQYYKILSQNLIIIYFKNQKNVVVPIQLIMSTDKKDNIESYLLSIN